MKKKYSELRTCYIMLLLDGGSGLLKVFLLRFFNIRILSNVRTPLHDQMRKVRGWSNTQVVFRFATIQLIISIITIYLIMLHKSSVTLIKLLIYKSVL